jgi:hypothetical protein
MKIRVHKEIHFKPWELLEVLKKTNLVSSDATSPSLVITERNDVNGGHTIILGYHEHEQVLGDDFNVVIPGEPV